jgi:hypothetical protein
VPGGVPGGQLGGVIGGIISSTSSLASVPTMSKPVTMPSRVRISQGVSKGLLAYQVEPTYPPLARQARIQGVVILTAMIDKDGTIQNLQVVSGHPRCGDRGRRVVFFNHLNFCGDAAGSTQLPIGHVTHDLHYLQCLCDRCRGRWRRWRRGRSCEEGH